MSDSVTAVRQATLSITNCRSLPNPCPLRWPSNHLILCRPLLLLPSIFPSIRVFSNESALRIRWPKYWSFSFNISPSNEHPGLISFSMDRLVGSPCSPRDSQESSPTPQFKSINSSVLSFLHSPTLTPAVHGVIEFDTNSGVHFHFCIHCSKNFQGNLYRLSALYFS